MQFAILGEKLSVFLHICIQINNGKLLVKENDLETEKYRVAQHKGER